MCLRWCQYLVQNFISPCDLAAMYVSLPCYDLYFSMLSSNFGPTGSAGKLLHLRMPIVVFVALELWLINFKHKCFNISCTVPGMPFCWRFCIESVFSTFFCDQKKFLFFNPLFHKHTVILATFCFVPPGNVSQLCGCVAVQLWPYFSVWSPCIILPPFSFLFVNFFSYFRFTIHYFILILH